VFEIGISLREARLRQQLELPEVEQATKIRGKYLRALEEEQFEVLPATTYVKGFLRAYADYLGLDGQLYVDEFNSRYIGGEEETPLRARRTSTVNTHRRVESNTILFALVAIGIVTALALAAAKFGGSKPQNTPLSAAATTPAAGHKTARPTVANLVLTASRGSAWLMVHGRSGSGPQLYQGVLEQGKSLPLSGKRLWINVDKPENLTVRLNGKLKPIPTGKPMVFLVTPKGVFRQNP
jgi:cytoskeleton protein RodZ